jgi:hypothetical protein
MLAILTALAVACGEPEEEVLTDATPTATPREKYTYIPQPDETPPISPYPVYPEVSSTPPPDNPLWFLTPTPPTSVTVLGRVIPLPPGAYYAEAIADCPPPEALPTGKRCSPHPRTIIRGTSTVSWDEYGILSTAVKSSDEADFQATLAELAKVDWKPLPAEDS